MYSQHTADLKAKVAIGSSMYLTPGSGKKMTNGEDFIYDEQDSEGFQSLKNFHLQMACFAVLFCLYIVQIFQRDLATILPNRHLFAYLSTHKYISQRTLRI